MSAPVKVLIAEDSPTAAALLREILSSDARIEIVGVAVDGRQAVQKTRTLDPDVITMDIHMPQMDGLAATKQIMIERPTPIVIVSASAGERDVRTSLDALQAGAAAILERPTLSAETFEQDRRELCRTVRALKGLKLVRHQQRNSTATGASNRQLGAQRAEVVAIAASTGGPAALREVLGALPVDFNAPVVVVQHITAGFLDGFVRWLDESVDLEVSVARAGETLEAGRVYLAPERSHLEIAPARQIELRADPPVQGHRPSANHLFSSCARAYGAGALALVLTGMGRDGLDGLRDIRRCGGRVLCQDEESCAVFGMPGAAVSERLHDQVLPLGTIADAIIRETNYASH